MVSYSATSEEKYLKSVVLFAKTATDNAHLCVDEAKEVEISKKELWNLLIKNEAVICTAKGEYYRPIYIKDNGTHASATVVNASGSYLTFHSTEQA